MPSISNNEFHLDRKAFAPIHPPGTLSTLPPEAHIGPVDPATLPKSQPELTDEEKRIARARADLPPPEAALNLRDIEVLFFLIQDEVSLIFDG